MGSLNELISLARSEEGYVEKASNKNHLILKLAIGEQIIIQNIQEM